MGLLPSSSIVALELQLMRTPERKRTTFTTFDYDRLRSIGWHTRSFIGMEAPGTFEQEKRKHDQRQARQYLTEFYQLNSFYLQEVCPLASIEAFIASSMHDGVDPDRMWALC